MANFFVSFTDKSSVGIQDESTGVHTGTSSTAGDKVELRFDQTLTIFEVYRALERFERYLKNGGLLAAVGSNIGPAA